VTGSQGRVEAKRRKRYLTRNRGRRVVRKRQGLGKRPPRNQKEAPEAREMREEGLLFTKHKTSAARMKRRGQKSKVCSAAENISDPSAENKEGNTHLRAAED